METTKGAAGCHKCVSPPASRQGQLLGILLCRSYKGQVQPESQNENFAIPNSVGKKKCGHLKGSSKVLDSNAGVGVTPKQTLVIQHGHCQFVAYPGLADSDGLFFPKNLTDHRLYISM